jgi:endonuclease-3
VKPARGKAGAAKASKHRTASRKAASRKTAARKAKRHGRRPHPERVAALIAALRAHDPDPRCALEHANPYELLAATILSAQCTDTRVNMVTPALFARYPTPARLGRARQEDVEELVHTTGFFRNKAKNLIGMGARLAEHFDGEVPRDMDELLSLPGVARKTANVVRGECFGLADGVVVDTHVLRIARRLGLTRETDPVRVERDLMELLPQTEWISFSHRIIRLGRSICPARKPRCEECPVRTLCPKVGV